MSIDPSTEDTLVLVTAEDAYQGDAEFTILVDGVQVGGVQTVTAISGRGQTQAFTVRGNFGTGPHNVSVTFLNDAFGGTATTDRNLYLDTIDYDGTFMAVNANVGGTITETVTPTSTPLATNTLLINVSEDAWDGDAQFVVMVDGVQVGPTETATASHAAGASENVALTGNFGAGPHSIVVTFVNDATAGTPAMDRNLYVNSVTYDGNTTAVGASLFSNGSTNPVIVSDPATVTPNAVVYPADTLVLDMAEDAYQGDAQFAVFVDGKQQVGGTMTVTASNATGAEETFTFYGSYGSGPHSVIVTFLNALAGSSTTSRNLYVKAVTYDGIAQAGIIGALPSGESTFSVQDTPSPVIQAPASSDTLTLYVSEDAYMGDAQFSVTVDGAQVGGVQTATGSHAAGDTRAVSLSGDFGSGPHTVAITFLNDASGGNYTVDRNLYVSGIDYNGVYTGVDASLFSTGDTSVTTVGGSGTPVTPLAPMSTSGTLQLVGVNLSGLEFGGPVYPGVLNTDYVEPTHAEIDYYASKGMNVIRLPFDWERLQPVQDGPLDPTQLAMLDDLVAYAGTKGMKVDLDPHNYGYGYGNEIGSSGTPNSSFADLWSKLATHFASSSNVMFGLMNEPHDQTAAQWLVSANDAIAAIRATGASQEILVPGTHYTGGSSWTTSDNASVMDGIVDPKMNFAFEIHQYLDADGSGTSTSVVSPTIGVERLTAVTQWAELTGTRLFLAEFGSGADAASLTAMKNMLDYMSQNTNVWQGATEWGGGPWWGNYGFATDPTNGVDTKQISLLQHYT